MLTDTTSDYELMIAWLYDLRDDYLIAYKQTHKSEYKTVWMEDIEMVEAIAEVVARMADLDD